MIGASFTPTGITYEVSGEYGEPLAGAPGGTVIAMQVGPTNLLLGDGVFISGQFGTAYNLGTITGYPVAGGAAGQLWFPPQVNKSQTLASYTASRMGVVVGGEQIGGLTARKIVNTPLQIGTLVATAATSQIVYVMTQGVCWATVDGAVAVGAKLTASASTAGFLSTTGAVAGNTMALALNSTAGSAVTLVLINVC
jgi:hypothetical protein